MKHSYDKIICFQNFPFDNWQTKSLSEVEEYFQLDVDAQLGRSSWNSL